MSFCIAFAISYGSGKHGTAYWVLITLFIANITCLSASSAVLMLPSLFLLSGPPQICRMIRISRSCPGSIFIDSVNTGLLREKPVLQHVYLFYLFSIFRIYPNRRVVCVGLRPHSQASVSTRALAFVPWCETIHFIQEVLCGMGRRTQMLRYGCPSPLG